MKILIVEDDRKIAEVLRLIISTYYVVETVTSGEQAMMRIEEDDFGLVILDLSLPDMHGLDICRSLRQAGRNMPILIITGEDRPTVMIELLEAGADDYITKPFRRKEVVARIKALVRRQETRSPAISQLVVGDVTLDLDQHCAIRKGVQIHLRSKEFIMLEQLMLNPNIVMSRSQLYSKAWDATEDNWNNTIDVHIKHLRDKIDRPFDVTSIKTVHGVGYKFVPVTAKFR